MYYLYILECNDGTFYTGITTDVGKRFEQHKAGKGARYTRVRGAKRICYTEEYTDRSSALKREYAIKQMTRSQKLVLIKNKLLLKQ